MEFENLSASYDVGIAKKYGIASAVLLNKLIYLAKYTPRDDGFCWRTAKELEDELGLSRYQQDLAIKKLEEAGIIETKNTYIIGTQVKCKHFRIISKCDFEETNKSEMQETYKCDFKETYKSDLRETNKSVNNNKNNNNNTIIIKHNNKENNIKENDDFEKLWKIYPNKKGKTKAKQSYLKAKKDNVTDEQIEDGIKRYLDYIKFEEVEPRFVKHGSTWFNGRCWEDDYTIKRRINTDDIAKEIDLTKIWR